MFFYDALDIAKKLGATLEELVPSNGKNEEAMNSLPDYKGSYGQIARVFKSGGYVEITNRTIDNVAAILAQGKPVLLGFTFTYAEWQARPAIGLYPPNLRHAVVATPYGFFLDTDGKKCIVIEDSWGLDRTTIGGRRVIDEMFFTRRSIFAGYVADLDNNWRDKAPEKPKVRLTIPLHRNETSDAIVGLQNILKYEQLFPQATQSTGFYGAVTSRGVAAYKALHGLAGNGDTVDAAMIDTINATYGI
jgi:hypothetical protein